MALLAPQTGNRNQHSLGDLGLVGNGDGFYKAVLGVRSKCGPAGPTFSLSSTRSLQNSVAVPVQYGVWSVNSISGNSLIRSRTLLSSEGKAFSRADLIILSASTVEITTL